jgi:hypothetical protein
MFFTMLFDSSLDTWRQVELPSAYSVICFGDHLRTLVDAEQTGDQVQLHY